MIFIPNCHWNHTNFNFGMIPVVIWYEYHTSVFAVYASLLKYGAELTNPEASTEAQVCKQRHDYTFSIHKLPEQIDYGDDVAI